MKALKLSSLGFAAMLMLGVASCSNDDLNISTDKPLDADKSFYINVSIAGNSTGTRGGNLGDYTTTDPYVPTNDPNFDPGDDDYDENTVNTVYLLFYDAAGRKLKNQNDIMLQNPEASAGVNASQNAIYKGTVQVDVERGENVPAYVLAFVNPVKKNFSTGFENLADVEQMTVSDLFNTTSKDFAMSNSVYYGKDDVTGAEEVRIMATPITSLQLFNSQQAAENALEADPVVNSVDIYVERYASKVNFRVDRTKIEAVANVKNVEGKPVTLTFVPEYWAVNGNELSSYVTKTFFQGTVADGTIDFTTPAPISYFNERLKGWKWNSPDFYRSYWGQSPSYYKAEYPRVADDILDHYVEADGSYTADWGAKYKSGDYRGDYELKYYSYNELAANAGTDVNSLARAIPTENNATTIYSRENTVSASALLTASKNPLASPVAAIASVVMVGHYDATVDGQKLNDEIFYIQGDGTNYIYFNPEQMLTRFLGNAIPFAVATTQDDKTVYTVLTGENLAENNAAGYFVIDHPTIDVRNNLVMDARYVTLQLTKEAIGKVYAKVGDDFQLVTADNISNINQQALSSAGTAYGYSNGHAYFNIPIQHLGYWRNGNDNAGKAPNQSGFDWTKVQSGDYGLVRNHLYSIDVTKISGLGYGIPRDDDPIVPPTDPDKYYIGARIVVLNWAIVPRQEVAL